MLEIFKRKCVGYWHRLVNFTLQGICLRAVSRVCIVFKGMGKVCCPFPGLNFFENLAVFVVVVFRSWEFSDNVEQIICRRGGGGGGS